ncbi:MAG: 16S rRNA processing protein RimM [Cytophagaceae bacterium]|nr:16S rRNA processing protein RimM [Cytophagaceae bacterium]MBK9509598.1 16S rRNA processing protein RimM [Cytophagaceae bacterium]MBK9936180.1 16S rRNA processing protein RimM [Cytophagaceae bacterium]MBL0303932.1 16S rRNA processing protein RimM [Cytophagaceae bacterium]MBL0326745.1 16S rRNA processing protein RimM [Cytophagaceae bacterium]
MKKNECYSLGKITKSHGLKGEVTIYLDVDQPENYKKLDVILLDIKGELIPYDVEKIQIRGKKSILKLKEITSIEETEKVVNAEVFLPLIALPKLKGNRFYYHEIIGYNIYDSNSEKEIGKIKAIYESTGNDLFAVDHNGVEILIPIVDQFIKKIDHQNTTIELNIPDGLVDVYLNS